MTEHRLYQAAPTGQHGTNNCNDGFSMWPNVEIAETDVVGPSAAHRGTMTHQVIERCLDFRPVPDSGPRYAWNNSDSLIDYNNRHPIQVDDLLEVIVIPAGEDWRTLYWTICNPAPGLTLGIKEVYGDKTLVSGIDAGVAPGDPGSCGLLDVVDDLGLARLDCGKNRMLAWVVEALPSPTAGVCQTAAGPLDKACFCMQAEVIHIHTGK